MTRRVTWGFSLFYGWILLAVFLVSVAAEANQFIAKERVITKKRSAGIGSDWVDAEVWQKGYFNPKNKFNEARSDETWVFFENEKGEERWVHRKSLTPVKVTAEAIAEQMKGFPAVVPPRECAQPPKPVKASAPPRATTTRDDRRPARQLRASPECIRFLQQFESTERDANGRMKLHKVNGNYVIGWGHEMTTPDEVEQYRGGISDAQADQLIQQDLKKFEKVIHQNFADTPLSQREFDALVSMVYNTGNRFPENPTFFKLLKNKPAGETPAQMEDRYRRAFNGILAYNKVKSRRTKKLEVWEGIQVRRAGELFLARNGRAPQKASKKDMAEMKRLYNEGIGNTGVAAHDTVSRRSEKWD